MKMLAMIKADRSNVRIRLKLLMQLFIEIAK